MVTAPTNRPETNRIDMDRPEMRDVSKDRESDKPLRMDETSWGRKVGLSWCEPQCGQRGASVTPSKLGVAPCAGREAFSNIISYLLKRKPRLPKGSRAWLYSGG